MQIMLLLKLIKVDVLCKADDEDWGLGIDFSDTH